MNKNIGKKSTLAAKKKKQVIAGVAHINASFNNTIVSISNMQGDVIAWSSSGSNSFEGSKKATPHAAQVTAEKAIKKAMEWGLKTVFIKVSGPGVGRDAAIRAIANLVIVTAIKDITPVPHNGCRPRKQRRM